MTHLLRNLTTGAEYDVADILGPESLEDLRPGERLVLHVGRMSVVLFVESTGISAAAQTEDGVENL